MPHLSSHPANERHSEGSVDTHDVRRDAFAIRPTVSNLVRRSGDLEGVPLLWLWSEGTMKSNTIISLSNKVCVCVCECKPFLQMKSRVVAQMSSLNFPGSMWSIPLMCTQSSLSSQLSGWPGPQRSRSCKEKTSGALQCPVSGTA